MEKKKIIDQLHRIEGQVRGVAGMVENKRGLVPTVTQLMAVSSALSRATRDYVSLFLREEGGEVTLTREQIDYILKLIGKF